MSIHHLRQQQESTDSKLVVLLADRPPQDRQICKGSLSLPQGTPRVTRKEEATAGATQEQES